MPVKGFKSITIREVVYERLNSKFMILKKKGLLPVGVTTFAGYFNYKISSYMIEKEKLQKLANKINKIPEKFLTKSLVKPTEIII